MWHTKESQRYMIAFTGTFLLFMLIRVALGFVPYIQGQPCFFYLMAQILCVLIVSCWMLTVQSRIIHRKTRQLMLGIGAFFLLYYMIQMMKYCLFIEDADLCRYLWYGYYIPMTIIPLLTFFILDYHSIPKNWGGVRFWISLTAIAGFICIGFLTNDFHQLAFQIPDWYEYREKGRTFGPVYYLYLMFMVLLFVLSMRDMRHLHRSRKSKRELIYPVVPLVIGILYIVAYTFDFDWIVIGSRRLLELSEIFTFMIIGALEMCIHIRLIPSNMGYGKLFSMSEISARVTGIDGKTVFETRGAKKGFEKSEDHHISLRSVKGGNFFYDIDLTNLNRLNRELQEITVNLESRNELLRHENEIVAERSRPEEAIRIYDTIAELVQPQILEVRELLSDDITDEEQLRTRLARSTLLNAYIKRRSNMELEARKNGTLPFRELVTAVAESMEYFKLSGADSFLSFSGEGMCSAGEIIQAYTLFERVVEQIFDKVEYVTVRITQEPAICLLFLISSQKKLPDLSVLDQEHCVVDYRQQDSDAKLVIRFLKGGDEA